MRIIEQRKLQVIHLLLLALVHHLCTPFCFHCLGCVLHPRLHSLSMNCRSAKHMLTVVGSGILKKESIASPKVTSVDSRDLTITVTIQQALTKLQQITTIMISNENCTLHFSAVLSLLHPLISTSSPVVSFIDHGSPLVTFDISLLGSVVHEPARGTPGLEGSSLSGTWTRGLEPGSSRQESAKNAPRGSNLESSRLVDPCPSRLEPPKDSSPLVDPCSSRQEAACQETRVRSARAQHYC